MNEYREIAVSYLRPSRTLETILLKRGEELRVLYVYNFEGIHFRVFFNLVEILEFFEDKFEPEIAFESEEELDQYLASVDLETISSDSLVGLCS